MIHGCSNYRDLIPQCSSQSQHSILEVTSKTAPVMKNLMKLSRLYTNYLAEEAVSVCTLDQLSSTKSILH
ncbi:hypothetical protein HAX54_008009 [Datura stramonium]|uniref:Uncharacterized protein n=1 Tax=Datura stramonium TaxID=4076 RepID=A0ABS8WZ48_DATST|nr:hypothetical protein [Datura stramonium]